MKNLITITISSIALVALLVYTSWVVIINELIKGYGMVLYEWVATGFLTLLYLGLFIGSRDKRWLL